jgi:hypothetical protein
MGKPRTICPTFWIGDVVCLKIDSDSEIGMITRVSIATNDNYIFQVSWGNAQDTHHYDIELELVEEKVPA